MAMNRTNWVIRTCEHGRKVTSGPCTLCARGPCSCADAADGRLIFHCEECRPIGICKHGRRKTACKECGGSAFCEHGRQKSLCEDCGGGGICEHKRRRTLCQDCGGGSATRTVAAARAASTTPTLGRQNTICEHDTLGRQLKRQKHDSKECGGGSICEHGRQKYSCEHGRQKYSCNACGFRHGGLNGGRLVFRTPQAGQLDHKQAPQQKRARAVLRVFCS